MADTPTDLPVDAAPADAPAAATVVVASAVPPGILSGVSTPRGPGTGAVTPAMSELPPDQVAYSLKVSLADLCAKAAVLYSQQKNYEEAAELYARAAEMQAEINGEMDPENAEILFLYGRSLFKVGQSKSDVLGGKAPETDKDGKDKQAKKDKVAAAPGAAGAAAADTPGGIIAQAITSSGSGSGSGSGGPAAETPDAKKPLFQFAGDEEWDASDDEEGAEGGGAAGEGDGDEEEDEDDLAVAFEVLDLARVLFEKQLNEKKAAAATTGEEGAALGEDATAAADKGKDAAAAAGEADEPASPIAEGVPGDLRHVLERLADTHDLLAEISLENERYPNAIVDSRASLAYKKQYLGEDSEIIAEAHFKLSLALEFASVTTTSKEDGGSGTGDKAEGQVDQALRDEAAAELEAAIASTQLKLQAKEVELATLHSPEDNDATRRQIAEVKDIISDMEQRLIDLRKPPIDLNAAVNGPAGAGLGGLLGALSGAGAAAAAGSVQEAKKTATDLTGLVRKKTKDAGETTAPPAQDAPSTTNGKRKAEEPADGSDDEAKKARTAEA